MPIEASVELEVAFIVEFDSFEFSSINIVSLLNIPIHTIFSISVNILIVFFLIFQSFDIFFYPSILHDQLDRFVSNRSLLLETLSKNLFSVLAHDSGRLKLIHQVHSVHGQTVGGDGCLVNFSGLLRTFHEKEVEEEVHKAREGDEDKQGDDSQHTSHFSEKNSQTRLPPKISGKGVRGRRFFPDWNLLN